MQVLQEAVVLIVGGELERVLVVSEESVVAVGKISEGASLTEQVVMLDIVESAKDTYDEEGVLDGGLVVHGAEVVLAERQDHKLLEEAVAHHELLGGARDVAVIVEDAHASEASDLDLEGDVGRQINSNLGLTGRVGPHVRGAGESSSEALVTDFVNHFYEYACYN